MAMGFLRFLRYKLRMPVRALDFREGVVVATVLRHRTGMSLFQPWGETQYVIRDRLAPHREMFLASRDMGKYREKILGEARDHGAAVVEAAVDYFRKNPSGSRRLLSLKNIPLRTALYTRRDARALARLSRAGFLWWSCFYHRYPDSHGLFSISIPGFSWDESCSVVYVGHSFGDLGGFGALYVLLKERRHWRMAGFFLGDYWVA